MHHGYEPADILGHRDRGRAHRRRPPGSTWTLDGTEQEREDTQPRTERMSDAGPHGTPALKDPDAAHPIADAWRPMLREVVRHLAQGDHALARGVRGVAPVAASTAGQMRDYIAEYGATLVELPDDTWQTSVAQWMGTHWEVLVDLWTAEEGRSDLVLAGDVVETSAGPLLTVRAVYVP